MESLETSVALETLVALGVQAPQIAAAIGWLSQESAANNGYLARKILALA